MDNILINGTRYITGSACKDLILEQIDHLLFIHKSLLIHVGILMFMVIVLMILYYKKVKNE